MLRRALFAALVIAVSMAGWSAPAGHASPVCEVFDKDLGLCKAEVPVPGAPAVPGAGSPGARVCDYSGTVVPCETELGTWVNSLNAYCKVMSPQPPRGDERWNGRTTGTLFNCRLKGGTSWGATLVHWMPSDTPVDPSELAQLAVAQLQIKAVKIGTHPLVKDKDKISAVVGQQIWMRAVDPDSTTWGPKDASVSVRGHTVSLSAKVEKVVWDMGDKKSVTCTQPGTKWEKWRVTSDAPDPKSPDCGYVYQVQGYYTVTATSHWVVRWTALNETGVIRLTLSDSMQWLVGEIQVLNVPPKR